MVISPYARPGYIDHRQLGHDAYLKFIEDDFLEGRRLNPKTDGRPDSRPGVREEAPGLGNLLSDFDFCQTPRASLILPTHPEPGPASSPPGSVASVPAQPEPGPCPALSPQRDALIGNAVIYAPRHGLIDFTVPHCGAFIRRRYPLAVRR